MHIIKCCPQISRLVLVFMKVGTWSYNLSKLWIKGWIRGQHLTLFHVYAQIIYIFPILPVYFQVFSWFSQNYSRNQEVMPALHVSLAVLHYTAWHYTVCNTIQLSAKQCTTLDCTTLFPLTTCDKCSVLESI